MPSIDAANMKLEALMAYDQMMIECVPTVKTFASLAAAVWTDVLKELDRRGKVRLVSGSYDDVGKRYFNGWHNQHDRIIHAGGGRKTLLYRGADR